MRLKDHIGKLEYFCAVAESRSIKSASQKILIGQPQLTKVIKQLEDILETQLFVRSAKGVTLTQSGDNLYKAAKKILGEVDKTEFLIKSPEKNLAGTVRIGTYDSIARYFFPEFLKYISITMPDVTIRLETGRSATVLKRLKKKSVDVAVFVSEGLSTRGLECREIYSDSFGLYRAPSMEDRFSKNLIYLPYDLNNTEATMGGFGFKESMVCDNLETVRALTEQGIGVGLLPHRVARESLMTHKLTPLHLKEIKDNTFDRHSISMAYHAKEDQPVREIILKEIQRFLQLWHQS